MTPINNLDMGLVLNIFWPNYVRIIRLWKDDAL